MALAILVVDRHAAVQQLGSSAGPSGSSMLDREQGLDLVEQEAAVAVGAGDQRVARLLGDRKGTAFDRLGALDQLVERVVIEPAEDQHLAARQQRGVELEARVLGRRADQRDGAVLDIGQEAVLLGAIEAVDLVHEQQRLLAGTCGRLRASAKIFLRSATPEKTAEIGDEAQPDRVGQQARDARLARPGRSPQDHRGELARRDHAPDRAVRTGQMLLPDDLVERLRAQPVGERRIGRAALRLAHSELLVAEQVGHAVRS